jgi:hypothetical protein
VMLYCQSLVKVQQSHISHILLHWFPSQKMKAKSEPVRQIQSVRFEVSTAVTMMIIIFWEMIIIKYNLV